MHLSRKIIPVLAGIGFVIFGLFTMQLGLAFIGVIFAGGMCLVSAISGKCDPKRRIVVRNVLIVALVGGDILFGFLARGTLPPPAETHVWVLHQIDNPGYLIPNGLSAADVDKDGFIDYLTNYEWDGMLRIAFHPGLAGVKGRWPAITVGARPNAESAVLEDIDGDGNFDVILAHGAELGAVPGVEITWGPAPSQARNPAAWVPGGDIPATVNLGHFNYVKCHDVNKDGATDILIGGRGSSPRAGLRWIEAPANPADRRVLANWQVHDIDPDVEGGYGAIFGDVNGDGHEDIVVSNIDLDTPDAQKAIVYYENPGTGTPAQGNPWTKHVIYQGPEFYAKPQLVLYNFIGGDNFPEVVVQTAHSVYIFQNPGAGGGTWQVINVTKTPETRWRCRGLKVADINQDGRPEIVGMAIQDEGFLPRDKAAVFYMTYRGASVAAATWETHVVKWGDGFFGIGTFNGEKWDQLLFEDVDQDGDIDIVANVEEYHTLGFAFLAVVWFENPLIA